MTQRVFLNKKIKNQNINDKTKSSNNTIIC